MKKLIFGLMVVVLFFVGCEGQNKTKCYSMVRARYPAPAVVFTVPDNSFTFVVVTDSSVRFARTMNMSDTQITEDIEIARTKQCRR